jgi:ADP-dependent phosphofructokinase/glucokinase
MKDLWIQKYTDLEGKSLGCRVLTGFDASVTVEAGFEDLDIELKDVEAEKKRKVESREDFLKNLRYCSEHQESLKTDLNGFRPEIEGEESISGQAATIANYISKSGARSVIYTPFLSEKIADNLDNEVLYPYIEENLVLKSVSEAVNSDRTEKNITITFEEGHKLELSDSLRGFGTFFRAGLEERFDHLSEEVDLAILSGFQKLEGNYESKLKKSEKQLKKLEIPKHIDFTGYNDEIERYILDDLLGCFESIGTDSEGLRQISEIIGYGLEDAISLNDVYELSKQLIDEYGVKRVQCRTDKFQATIARKEHRNSVEEMREGLLYAGLSAIATAEEGVIPRAEDLKLDTDVTHVKNLDELEDFQKHFSLDNFTESGTAEIEGYKIAAVPALIHEDPENTGTIGEIISAAAFTAESHLD